MLEIDGSQHSGSGTIVRQAVAFSALTGRSIHIVNARVRRPQPGLRHQHVCVVEAIRELVDGVAEGVTPGSREIWFTPGAIKTSRRYIWDIGTAGSTTMLALGLLPVLAYASAPLQIELHGGLFQDFAPSLFHLQAVMLPLLGRMGFEVDMSMSRPGYVPRGEGVLHVTATPTSGPLQAVRWDQQGRVCRLWGIALSSHLDERHVSERMSEAAQDVLRTRGYQAEIELRHDHTSLQPGAALGLFAEFDGGARLGADRAGALRRPAESIGRYAAMELLADWDSGATVDRYAADQIVPFAALAAGQTRVRIPHVTDHLRTAVWLAELFLGAHVTLDAGVLTIDGIGFGPPGPAAVRGDATDKA